MTDSKETKLHRQALKKAEADHLPAKDIDFLAKGLANHELADIARDAVRYRYLRDRDLDTISKGGVFAGLTPDNLVLSGVDLDKAVDRAITKAEEIEKSVDSFTLTASTNQ